MNTNLTPNQSFKKGYIVSLSAHAFFGLWMLFGPGSHVSSTLAPTVVYTVTIEGGDRIGGISQVPIKDPVKKVLPNMQEPLPVQEKPINEKTKPLEQPSVVEEKKLLEEQKAKEIKEQEKELAEQKLAEKKLEEKKLKEELAKKEKLKAEEEKKKKEKEKKERDAKLEKAIKNATNYTGESTAAGGEGIGSAVQSNKKGMGGGTPASMEFILYRNALEQHIKGGWRWPPSPDPLRAQIEFNIMQDGTVQNPRVSATSGNSSFDDSALRAVYKASPVPVPPADLYEQFQRARMTFDSEQ